MAIPEFREDGYLPEGLHPATEDEVIARFGQSTTRREYLAPRLPLWLHLARAVGGLRFVVNGSFVTAKEDPGDIDAVVWLPEAFLDQVASGRSEAVTLQSLLLSREPKELFHVYSHARWERWIEFFSMTREVDGRRKGMVEIRL
jgi:hypothetical protein